MKKVHLLAGAFLLLFFVSVSCLFLWWETRKEGLEMVDTDGVFFPQNWLPLNQLHQNACLAMGDSLAHELAREQFRFIVSPGKEAVTFIFDNRALHIQIDAATGQLVRLEKSRSGFFTMLNHFLDPRKVQIQLFYCLVAGITLFLFKKITNALL